MRRGIIGLGLCALLAALAQPASAQDYVQLPLRLDLVDDELTPPAAGYTALAPDAVYDPGAAQPIWYGWDADKSGVTFDFLEPIADPDPEDIAAEPSGDWLNALPQGDSFPDYEHLVDLYGEAHHFHGSTNVFRARVPGGTERVLVHVVLGQPDEPVHGWQVYAAEPDAQEELPPGALVTTEPYPWDTEESPFGPYVGIWTRTLMNKASFEKPAGPQGYDNVGGWRNIWFAMDTQPIDGTSAELVAFTIHNPISPGSSPALEIFAYGPDRQPPLLFDESDTATPLEVNAAYAFDPASDETDLADGIDDLHAGDLAAAATHFDAIGDDVTRAAALLWLAGWLGDAAPLFAADGVEWQRLLEAIDLLDDVNLSTDDRGAWVAEYLDRAQQYRRALIHHRLRGYTTVTFPGGLQVDNYLRAAFEYDSLIRNLGVAEARWRDVGAQDVDSVVGNPYIAVNPLFFKSLVYLGINHWSRQTKNSYDDTASPLPQSYWFIKQHFTLWKQLAAGGWCTGVSGANTGLFGDHDALAVLNHMATYDKPGPGGSAPDGVEEYDEDQTGGIIGKWTGEGSTAAHGTGESRWWDVLLADAADIDPGDPGCAANTSWSRSQRRFDVAFREGNAWWAEHGENEGELGGGGSDDVEYVLQLLYPTFPQRGGFGAIEQLARAVIDANLAEWIPTGYYFGDGSDTTAADVEHTAEFTGDPLFAAMQLQRGHPYYTEYAMQGTKFLRDDALPTGLNWTERLVLDDDPFSQGAPYGVHTYPDGLGGTPDIDLRRFQSWWFDAEGTAPSPAYLGDVPLNGRAVFPAYLLNAYNRNPEAMQLMREWAEWWWVVAMDDGSLTDGSGEQAKLRGVLPAVANYVRTVELVEYGDPAAPSLQWWAGGYSGDDPASGYAYTLATSPHVYGLFTWRYLDPETPSAERADYLLPLYHVGRIVAEVWRQSLFATPPGPAIDGVDIDVDDPAPTGGDLWTAQQLTASPAVLDMLLGHLRYFEREFAGSVEWPDHDDVMDYLEAGLGCVKPAGYGGSFTYRNCPVYGQAVLDPDTSDNKVGLGAAFDVGYTWLDAFFAIPTTFVSYTDRIFMVRNGANGTTFSCGTGGHLVPQPNYNVTWETLEPDVPLELSTLVLGWQEGLGFEVGDVWRAIAVNFEDHASATDRTVRLRLWHGFVPGSYTLSVGANDGDDAIDTGLPVDTYPVTIGHFPGTDFVDIELPYTSDVLCGTERVLELELDSLDTNPIGDFRDVGIMKSDLTAYLQGSRVVVSLQIHNLGTEDLTNVPWDMTTRLAGVPLIGDPDWGAPTTTGKTLSGRLDGQHDLEPSTGTSLTLGPLTGMQLYLLEVTATLTQPGDMNAENDEVKRVFLVTQGGVSIWQQ